MDKETKKDVWRANISRMKYEIPMAVVLWSGTYNDELTMFALCNINV